MAKKFGSAAAFKALLQALLRTWAEQTDAPLGTLQLRS
jgi:hypothetical protein